MRRVRRDIATSLFAATLAACGGGSGRDSQTDATAVAASDRNSEAASTPESSRAHAHALAVALSTVPSQGGWQRVATEGQSFNVASSTTVRYGSGTQWVTKVLSSNVSCTNEFFEIDDEALTR